MKLLSQNNPEWKLKKLGFSDVTIGSYGCVITCYAMLWNSDPVAVNDYFKENDLYVNLNLVYWAKTPGFVWRGWEYDNEKVKEAVSKYRGCIVETDFDDNPRNGKHFVVAIGNGKIYDPWDGKEKDFSSYNYVYGYVVIDPIKNPLGGVISDPQEIDQLKKKVTELEGELERARDAHRVDNEKNEAYAKELEIDVKEEQERYTRNMQAIAEKLKVTDDLTTILKATEKLLVAEAGLIDCLDAKRDCTDSYLALDKEYGQMKENIKLKTGYSIASPSGVNKALAAYRTLLDETPGIEEASTGELWDELVKRILNKLKRR